MNRLLLALGLVLLCPAAAQATAPYTLEELAARWAPTAERAAAMLPSTETCSGRPQYVVDTPRVIATDPLAPVAAAISWQDQCVVAFHAALAPRTNQDFCNLIVHERLHLSGYPHYTIADGIPAGDPRTTLVGLSDDGPYAEWSGCQPSRRQNVDELMRSDFPGRRYHCAMHARGLLRCRVLLRKHHYRIIRFRGPTGRQLDISRLKEAEK